MNTAHRKWGDVERLAAEKLKIERGTIRKWRQRGVPAKQAMRLIAVSDGRLCLNDFVGNEDASQEHA